MVKCPICDEEIPIDEYPQHYGGHSRGSSEHRGIPEPFSLESIRSVLIADVPDNIPEAIENRDWRYLLMGALPRLCFAVEYMEGTGKITPIEAADLRAWILKALRIVSFNITGFRDEELENAIRVHFKHFPSLKGF